MLFKTRHAKNREKGRVAFLKSKYLNLRFIEMVITWIREVIYNFLLIMYNFIWLEAYQKLYDGWIFNFENCVEACESVWKKYLINKEYHQIDEYDLLPIVPTCVDRNFSWWHNPVYCPKKKTLAEWLEREVEWRDKLNDHEFKLSFENYNIFKDSMNSPLESFNVVLESKFLFFDNLTINIFLIFFSIIFIFYIFNNNLNLKKNIVLILVLKTFFDFFFMIFKSLILNVRFERYFFFILSIVIFIIFENIGGFFLIELSLNSHIVITLFLSFMLFFNFTINFIITFNELSYKKFVQSNVNLFIAIFLFFVELISFFIRPFSLGVRLFANILSGHILMHIFFNVFVMLFKLFFWYSLIIFFFCLFILSMEIFVAFIQVYIFFILNLIYLKDVSRIH